MQVKFGAKGAMLRGKPDAEPSRSATGDLALPADESY
jgi:hypothetical protein